MSRPFFLSTDTTTDLPVSYYKENDLLLLPIGYSIDGISYRGDESYLGTDTLEIKDFYDKMRSGLQATTSQVPPELAAEMFEKVIVEGYDILHISFSSGLSGSFNSARIAASDLEEKYPGCRIIVVDSLCASMGEGLFVHSAVQMKKQGKEMEEIATWLEENKLHLCHFFTVDDLNHLYRGGRVSKTTAIVGTMLGIKPVLHVDNEGKLIPIGKVRGRRQSLLALVDHMAKEQGSYQNDTVFISHGDCIEDAEFVAQQVRERFGIENIIIHTIGQTIGAHSGPGTVALFFYGEER